MQVVQSNQQLPDEMPDSVLGKPSRGTLEAVQKRLWDKVEHQAQLSLMIEALQQLNDIWMVQPPQQCHFPSRCLANLTAKTSLVGTDHILNLNVAGNVTAS